MNERNIVIVGVFLLITNVLYYIIKQSNHGKVANDILKNAYNISSGG